MISVITTPLVTATGVQDVFIAEDRYAIVATCSGVEVIDLFCGAVISSGRLGGEPLSVVAETTTVSGNLYVGTTSSGIYSVRWKPLRQPGLDFTDQLVQTFTTTSTPGVSDNRINDLAVLPVRLLISTGLGIDFITNEDLLATRALVSGSNSCQMTAEGEAYWTTVNSGVEANYDLFPTSGTSIINVDFLYSTGSVPALPHGAVEDISVVPGSPNLLGFATFLGAFIVEEQQFSEASSQTLTLFPKEEPVVSIDFSKEAAFDAGTVYVAASGTIRIFGLTDTTISGVHLHTIIDPLDEDNARDQALVTGTVNVVRTTGVA